MPKLTRWLVGWVRFTVKSGGERFLNSCARKGVLLWDIRPGPQISCCIRDSSYRDLRPIARQAKVKIRLQKKAGLKRRIWALKKRPGLVIGAVLCLLNLWYLSHFLWTINIQMQGAETLTPQKIEDTLKQLGITSGTPKAEIPTGKVQAHLMDAFPEISWVTVNDRGCDLEIHVTEKSNAPAVEDKTGWCHLRAKCSGVITRTEVFAGKALVKAGDGVYEGQLLVSSAVVDHEREFYQMTHASGKIYADTKHVLKEQVPLSMEISEEDGSVIVRRGLRIFGMQIPLSFSLPPQGEARHEFESQTLAAGDTALPVSLEEEKIYPLKKVSVERTEEQAMAEADRLLSEQEEQANIDGEILKREDQSKIENGVLCVERTLNCEENIAEEVKISVD